MAMMVWATFAQTGCADDGLPDPPHAYWSIVSTSDAEAAQNLGAVAAACRHETPNERTSPSSYSWAHVPQANAIRSYACAALRTTTGNVA